MAFLRNILTCSAIARAFATVLAAGPVLTTAAQSQSATGPGATFETRASLEALAAAAEKDGRAGAAKVIRARLVAGDFRPGNRIIVEVKNSPAMKGADTLVVRDGPKVRFEPPVPELDLTGVLRSEIEARITSHIAKYLVNPAVEVTPLMRLSVIGAVMRSGYIDVSPSLLLSDVITTAGGYGAQADPEKIVVRRGTETVWEATEVRIALTQGYTVDRFSLRDGDELVVPQKAQRSWMTTVQFIVGTASLIVLLATQLR